MTTKQTYNLIIELTLAGVEYPSDIAAQTGLDLEVINTALRIESLGAYLSDDTIDDPLAWEELMYLQTHLEELVHNV